MKVIVKQCDIDNGTRRNQWLCPVARAITKDLPVGYEASVGHETIGIYTGGACVWCECMSNGMAYWVECFDEYCAVAPVEFELDISNPIHWMS
jgi:hypothetical protein